MNIILAYGSNYLCYIKLGNFDIQVHSITDFFFLSA